MTNLLNLPQHCIESIAKQFKSRYFPPKDLSLVLSSFDNENYCKYILCGNFSCKEHEYFDNIYINISNIKPTPEDRKNFRIINREFLFSNLIEYLELQKLCLAPLLRIWTIDPNLHIILALHPYVIRFRGNGRVIIFKDDISSTENLEIRQDMVKKIWGSQQLLLKDYQYFKQRETENITDLTIELHEDMNKDMEGLRYLHPIILKVIIKSTKLTYSGDIIAQVLDLTNVRKFTFSYPVAGSRVTNWNFIAEDLEVVKVLDISLGTIVNTNDFLNYEARSIDEFKLTLLGGKDNLDQIKSSVRRIMRSDNYEVVFKHKSEIIN